MSGRIDPHKTAIAGLLKRAAGEDLEPGEVANLRQCYGDPDVARIDGSGNWPYLAATALEDWRWLELALAAMRRRGLMGREIGSCTYGGDGWAWAIVAHLLAVAGGKSVAGQLGELINALAAAHALAAWPTAAAVVRLWGNEKLESIPTGQYTGLGNGLPSPRSGPEKSDQGGALASLVLGRETRVKPRWNPGQGFAFWPIEVISRRGWNLNAKSGAAVPGGHPAAREAAGYLGRVLEGEGRAAAELVRIVAAFGGVMGGMTIIRTDRGVLAWTPAGRSGNKPDAIVSTIGTNAAGVVERGLFAPSIWRPVKATIPHAREVLGAGVEVSADGRSWTAPYPDGQMGYRVELPAARGDA